ncbi:MAG: high-affinity iron transporter [Chloroflexi bacterium]|nr:high-affinity iron transporter [Chloroflexota bacterium]
MFPAFLLALREGIEAALIVGILFSVLRKLDRSDLGKIVWKGVISAALISLFGALLLYFLGSSLQGQAEMVFEGSTMLLAAAILTWMIFWMGQQARFLQQKLEADIRSAIQKSAAVPLFLMVFLAVLREGIELALFLTAATFTTNAQATLIGALLGLATAVVLGYALFTATVRLDLRRFFQVSSVLLLLFAAGLVAHGVHEFNEVGWIPAVIEHVWDINYLLDENSVLGTILKSLLGYNGNPSLTEVLAYFSYFAAVLFTLHKQNQKVLHPSTA